MPKLKSKDLQDLRRMQLIGGQFTSQRARRMCMDKRQFATRNEARDFGKRGDKWFHSGEMGVYRCPLCKKFHLTTLKLHD